MTNMQAYLGLSQLSKLEKILNSKRAIHKEYEKIFKNNKYFRLNSEKKYCKVTIGWTVSLLKKYIKDRNKIILKLMKRKIFVDHFGENSLL